MHGSSGSVARRGCWALTFAACLWLTVWTQPAQADPPPKYAVIPVSKNDDHLSQLVRLAEAIDAELEQRQTPHVRVAAARGLFETQHSREPIAASKEDIDLLVQAGNKALAASSNADWKTALEQLKIAMAKGARALESTNRNYKTAQHLFHACLLAVQGMVENGNEVEARRQAIECRVRSPGMELPPDSRDYPPYVRDYLAEAREALAQAHTAPLIVTSDPSGCSVYVNGRKLGTTPYRQDNPARRPQLVQVECGEGNPGRVHTIDPGDNTPPLFVNTVFESAVATNGGILRLRYEQTEDPHTQNHVRMIVEALGAREGLALTHGQPDRLAITRYGAGPSSTVTLHESFTANELADALATLLTDAEPAEQPRLVVDGATHPTVLAGSPGRAALAREKHATPVFSARTLGATGVVAGTGALVGAFWLYVQRRDDGAAFRTTLPTDPAYLERGDAWVDARKAPYLLAAAGSAAFTAGATTLAFAHRSERYPWWAYASTAGLGLSLAAWGVADLAQGGACDTATETDRRFCVLDQERRDRGALLLMNAFPLLFTPAVHYLFARRRSDRAISVVPSLGRTSLQLNIGLHL